MFTKKRKKKGLTILLEKNRDYKINNCGRFFLSIRRKTEVGKIALIPEGKVSFIGW